MPISDNPPALDGPSFSVLILLWNSGPYIRECLQALARQTERDFEVVLVDNGSPEPFRREVLDEFPGLAVRYFQLPANLGFAAGNNYAARQARGRYLVLLNSDAYPQEDWLAVIRGAALAHPGCSFASKLVMAKTPHLLDGEGDIYHASGVVWRKSYGKPVAQAKQTPGEVFSPCGAAAIFPKGAYDSVGGFDEDFFAYVEDVDLGFRLRLKGVACIYLPSAVVYHVGSGSTSLRSDFSVYYGQRNLVWAFIKNMPALLLALLLPFHLLMNLGMMALACLRRQGKITLKAKRDALGGLGKVLKKRQAVQRGRSASLLSVARAIDWNPLSPLLKLLIK